MYNAYSGRIFVSIIMALSMYGPWSESGLSLESDSGSGPRSGQGSSPRSGPKPGPRSGLGSSQGTRPDSCRVLPLSNRQGLLAVDSF